jgi:nucleoside-diphosphate-sugar epimerase
LRLFIFGPGYVGAAFAGRLGRQGWEISATARDEAGRARLTDLGWTAVDPASPSDLAVAVAASDAVLITAPPDERGCPALVALGPALAAADRRPSWIGYLSSTGVYGDRGGGWVNEDSPLNAQSLSGARRTAAEGDWADFSRREALTLAIFRLPGIYGPGRSAFDRLRQGTAQRIVRPGQVFSRIHVDDIVAALAAALSRPGGVFNLCDDEPSPPQDVIAYAAGLLGVEPPPAIAFDPSAVAPESRRFFAESKRVSNARAKAALGWRPAYPSYREGLKAILDQW